MDDRSVPNAHAYADARLDPTFPRTPHVIRA